MTSTNTAASKAAKAPSRLNYQDQLHVWLVGLRLNIFGLVSHKPIAFDLLIDRGLAVDELNRHCDVIVSEKSIQTVVKTFRNAEAPYSSFAPPKRAKTAPPVKSSKQPMTRYERSKLGPHMRGLIDRPRENVTM